MSQAFPTAPPGIFMDDGNKPAAHGYGINWEDPSAQGLAGLWPMWEGAGSRAQDLVNGHHGQIIGATWVVSRFGPALKFNGIDDTVVIGTDYGRPVKEMTVATWIKVDAMAGAGDHDIIIGDALLSGLNRGWALQLYDEDKIRFWVNQWDGNFADVTSFTDTSSWHSVVGVYDGTNIYIYLDGVIGAVTDTHSSTINYTATGPGLQFGQGFTGGGDWFTGEVDQGAVYNRAFTLSEIQQYHERPFGLTTPESGVVTPPPAVGNPWYYYAQQHALSG